MPSKLSACNPFFKPTLSYAISFFLFVGLLGCSATSFETTLNSTVENQRIDTSIELSAATPIFGTDINFAKEAIYFVLTDRFVDGDPSNNHEIQGGEFATFNIPLLGPNDQQANVGYLGGDFQGVLNNGQYIKDMGFTSVWLTPIFDNPDQAFSGGDPITYGGKFKDGGKTGYHGYWGVNFFKVDEHLISNNLNFKDFAQRLESDHQLNFVLDIVANHGSPSYTMPVDQPKFGELYNQYDVLIADHQNITPGQLSTDSSLHQFFNRQPDIAQLSDFNENNPKVLEYFTDAYLQWLAQGADSIRIDTIKHMPHHFWKKLTDNLRAVHPELFIFAESYSYDANFIAEHTQPENGGVSVLDFPGQKAITGVFENPTSDYADILSYLYLTDTPYQNPYELITFYDNHDMARMNADDAGFINANNWLFTARGIPAIYYGAELNFMTGKSEHEGNRNYLGQANIEKAKSHIIHRNLTKIANIRKHNIALQKGQQINIDVKDDHAIFYRVYQHQGINQTALVLLNKSGKAQTLSVKDFDNNGQWRDAQTNQLIPTPLNVQTQLTELSIDVPSHGVKVLLLNQAITNAHLLDLLQPK
jgi:glycosidase